TARSNASAFACDGLLKPESLRTNCSAEAWTSSSVAGGSKLNNVSMLRHIASVLQRVDIMRPLYQNRAARAKRHANSGTVVPLSRRCNRGRFVVDSTTISNPYRQVRHDSRH